MSDRRLDLDSRWQTLLLEEARARHPDLPIEPAALARRLTPHVVALSKGLTRARALAGDRYLDTRELALAYLLYFLPANAWKSRVLLERLFQAGRATPAHEQPAAGGALPARSPAERAVPLEGVLRVSDLGCGPGTQLWALIDALVWARSPEAMPLELHYRGVDHSAAALETVRSLARRLERVPGLAPGIRLRLTLSRELLTSPAALPEPGLDLLLLGNVVNELWADAPDALARRQGWVSEAFSRLRPGGALLLLEPALQATAESLERIRDGLLERPDVSILSPCTHAAPCPLVAPGRPPHQWCHQELRWRRPAWIEAVDRTTGLSKDRLTMSHLLVRRLETSLHCEAGERVAGASVAVGEERGAAPPRATARYRALSPALRGKGTVTVHLCGLEGFQETTLLTKHTSEANKAFLEIGRGDEVVLSGAVAKGRGLRVEAESVVERVEAESVVERVEAAVRG